MSSESKSALFGAIFYTVIVVGPILYIQMGTDIDLVDGWSAFLLLAAFIFLVFGVWVPGGIRGWPSYLPNPF